MQFVGKVITSVSEFYKDINPSTLSGAIDVLVVEDSVTGQLSCSPFHVRFGKFQLLRPQEKIVDVRVNGRVVEAVKMKVGEAGETFFVLPTLKGAVPEEYLTSPLLTSLSPPTTAMEHLSLNSPEKPPISPPSITTTATATAHRQPVSDSEDGDRGLRKKHAAGPTVLSDSEIEIGPAGVEGDKSLSPPPAERSGAEHLAPGSPPKYSWMWGGLPQKTSPLSALPLPPLNYPSLHPGDGDAEIDGPSAALPHASHPPTIPRPASIDALSEPETVDIFDYPNRPVVFHGMYWRFAQLGGEAKPTLEIYVSKADPEVSSAAPVGVDTRELSGDTELLRRTIESSLYKIEWDLFADDPASALAELAVPNKRMLLVVDGSIVFTGSVGYSLVMGRLLFSQTIPYQTMLTRFPILDPIPRARGGTKDERKSSGGSVGGVVVVVGGGGGGGGMSSINGGWRWWSRSSTSASALLDFPKDPERTFSVPELLDASLMSPTMVAKAEATPLPPSPVECSPTLTSSTDASGEDKIYYSKSLRLPHELLVALDLQPGANSISFTVTTKLQGIATCTARIFRWKSDARIVISDIDGTITKSDALGHLFTFVGKDWTHSGIANLYTNISGNGYRFVYLTSRSLGQAGITRGYLKGVEQNKFQLPDGPVIMSPDRLLAALRREVVVGNPQEFKIACLKDLQQLFYTCTASSEQQNPFYAGFGNRSNDAHAYSAIGIPPQRIFIINPSGTVSVEPLADQYCSSYGQLVDLVDAIFPPLSADKRHCALTEEPYNDFWYWRRPVSFAAPLSDRETSVVVAASTPHGLDAVQTGEEDEQDEEGLVPAYYV